MFAVINAQTLTVESRHRSLDAAERAASKINRQLKARGYSPIFEAWSLEGLRTVNNRIVTTVTGAPETTP